MKRSTILVVPISAVGHVNACRGTTLPLLKRGHRVIFVVEQPYSGTLKAFGFEEHVFTVQQGEDNVRDYLFSWNKKIALCNSGILLVAILTFCNRPLCFVQ